MTYTPANSATVTEAGTYEITYRANASVDTATTVTLAVRQNGTDISEATDSRVLTAGEEASFGGSAIVTLPAGAVLDLALSSLDAASATLGAGMNAAFTVKKLNA